MASGPEDFTLDKFIALSDGHAILKPNKTPLLIIKYGPPGSGKTSADNQVEKLFSVNLDNFVKVDKDTPLTSIKSFRDGSIKIIKRHDGLHYHHKAQHRVQKLQNKTLKAKNKDGLSINEKVPIILQRAFDYNFNILWETTCQSASSQDLMAAVFKTVPKIYRIVVIFPIVSLKTARQRVAQRATAHLALNPPYYRPVPYDRLKQATHESRKYFMTHIMPKVLDGTIYQLFCYNNTTNPTQEDYDTITNKNVQNRKRKTRRLAPGWRFGLNKSGKRTTLHKPRLE